MDEMMFCYQCEQAANCTACTGKAGVCGKSAETADAQDRLTGALIGFATLLLDIGKPIQPPQALLLLEGLFTTITNVNFDPETVAQLTDKVWKAKQEAFASASPAPAPVSDYDMQKLWQEPDPDVKSLKSFVLFGLRGMAAYSYHARVLGYTEHSFAHVTKVARSGTRTSSSSWWRTPGGWPTGSWPCSTRPTPARLAPPSR